MKRTWLKWSFIATAVVFIAGLPSCYTNTYYYNPHVQVPSHQQKGDLDFNAQGLAKGSVGVSYAATDNLFIGGSLSGYTSRDSTGNARGDYYNTATVEGGYYFKNPNNNFNFSAMGGLGSGKVGDLSSGFKNEFTRWYLQPTISFISDKRNLENHFSFRYTTVYYGESEGNNAPAFNAGYVEPHYTVRVGSPNVRFHMQLGMSIDFTEDENKPGDYLYVPFTLGFGVHANLNVLNMLNK